MSYLPSVVTSAILSVGFVKATFLDFSDTPTEKLHNKILGY
jgi:hypothetical protein